MSKRGENIYKRKDGRWEGRCVKDHINGKARYCYVYAQTYNEVKRRLREAVNRSHDVCIPQVSAQFSAVADEWLSAKTAQLKESSIAKYSNLLNNHLLPAFGERSVTSITSADIFQYRNDLLCTAGISDSGLSPKSVASILSVLKLILAYAAHKGLPVADIGQITVKQPQKPLRVLSIAEQKTLSRYLCNNLTLSNLGILVCLYTGLRVGELCALQWKNISLQEQSIYVRQTIQRVQTRTGDSKTSVLITKPKSSCSIRSIPISAALLPLLEPIQASEGSFFLTGSTSNYIEPRTMQNRFKTVLRACGIEDANFHALRHTFATRCIECGFDVKSLSEILGHASVNITLNRYVHPSMELKRQNMNKLPEFIAVK